MNSLPFCNPFIENERETLPEPCIVVIFGASGDLTHRKIIPALFNLMKSGELPTNFTCVGIARRSKTHVEFRKEMTESIHHYANTKIELPEISAFTEALFYHCMNFQDDQGYLSLVEFLKKLDGQRGTKGNRLFYLAVPPNYFLTIIEKLSHYALIYPHQQKLCFSRVVIEKPFGRDYQSAFTLQNDLLKYLAEEQIYLIDHYLGKETVQNLLVFRFSNFLFEPIWNQQYVDNIQITIAEKIGVEGRGNFYETEGLLRDVLQNHAVQLLSLVTMEAPLNLTPKEIHKEKVKVLQAIPQFSEEMIAKYVIRGQYSAGFIDGQPKSAYREEPNVNPNSNIETFAALRLQIENWRWHGVPIYIRAGKRLPKRSTEIVVTFKRAPPILFQKRYDNRSDNFSNRIIFRIQPNEGISLEFNTKVPTTQVIQLLNMDFQYAEHFGMITPEAYERLLSDAIKGDGTLFIKFDESLCAWKFLDPMLHEWHDKPLKTEEFYASGTWGPFTLSEQLLKQDQRTWKLP